MAYIARGYALQAATYMLHLSRVARTGGPRVATSSSLPVFSLLVTCSRLYVETHKAKEITWELPGTACINNATANRFLGENGSDGLYLLHWESRSISQVCILGNCSLYFQLTAFKPFISLIIFSGVTECQRMQVIIAHRLPTTFARKVGGAAITVAVHCVIKSNNNALLTQWTHSS